MQGQDSALQPLDNISNISESHMLLPSGEGLKQGSAKSKGGGAGGGAGGALAAERAKRSVEVEEQIKENRGMRFRQIMDHLVSAPSLICKVVFFPSRRAQESQVPILPPWLNPLLPVHS